MGLSPHFLLGALQKGNSVSEARYESFSAHTMEAASTGSGVGGGNEIHAAEP